MSNTYKKCCHCKKLKLTSEFYRDKSKKDKLSHRCKECRILYDKKRQTHIQNYQKKYFERMKPWNKTYRNIVQRCNNKNHNQFKDYGGRGIKNLITKEELKLLWFRDKAYEMNKPSIDRKDPDGNYIFENCRYIEMSENIARKRHKI